jgi:hypothetical protein
MTDFTPNQWQNAPPGYKEGDPLPPGATPLDAAGMNDLEGRVKGAADNLRHDVDLSQAAIDDLANQLPIDPNASVRSADATGMLRILPSEPQQGDGASSQYLGSRLGRKVYGPVGEDGGFPVDPVSQLPHPLQARLFWYPNIPGPDELREGDAWIVRDPATGQRRIEGIPPANEGGSVTPPPSPDVPEPVDFRLTSVNTAAQPVVALAVPGIEDQVTARWEFQYRITGGSTWTVDRSVSRPATGTGYQYTYVGPAAAGTTYDLRVVAYNQTGTKSTSSPQPYPTVTIPLNRGARILGAVQVMPAAADSTQNQWTYNTTPAGARRSAQVSDTELFALHFSSTVAPSSVADAYGVGIAPVGPPVKTAAAGTYVAFYTRSLTFTQAAATTLTFGPVANTAQHELTRILFEGDSVNNSQIAPANVYIDPIAADDGQGLLPRRVTSTVDDALAVCFAFGDTGSSAAGDQWSVTGAVKLGGGQTSATAGGRAMAVASAADLDTNEQMPVVSFSLATPAAATDSYAVATVLLIPAGVTPPPPGGGGGGGGTTVGSRDTANVLWGDNDNLANVPSIAYNGQEVGTTKTLVTDVSRHPGGKAIRITTPANVNRYVRNQMYQAGQGVTGGGSSLQTYGDTRWYGVSMRLGTDWDLTPGTATFGNGDTNFLLLYSFRWFGIPGQDVGSIPGVSPNFDGRIINGVAGFMNAWLATTRTGTNRHQKIVLPFSQYQKGTWIDIIRSVRWNDAGQSNGVDRLWIKGGTDTEYTQVDEVTGELAFYAGSTWRNLAGVYQGTQINHTRTIWYDEWRVGRTREAVDPAIPPGS